MGLHCNGTLFALATNVRLEWKWQEVFKHSSLLRYGNNNGRKKFYSTGPWAQKTFYARNLIMFVIS
jgi:hypothetical protein